MNGPQKNTLCPPPADPIPLPKSTTERDTALATLAKALGHPTRVAIIRRLRTVDTCVSEIVDALPLAQSTVSQHLKVLKDAGLIRGSIQGPKVSYCLESSLLEYLQLLIEEL